MNKLLVYYFKCVELYWDNDEYINCYNEVYE